MLRLGMGPSPSLSTARRTEVREGWRGVWGTEQECCSVTLVCVWGLSWAALCVPPEQRSRKGHSHFGHLTAGQALRAGTSPPSNPREEQPLQLCPAIVSIPLAHREQLVLGPSILAGLTTHLSILKPLLHWEYYCFFHTVI